MRELVEREVPCRKCKGTGEVIDVFEAFVTFGMSLLTGKDPCPKCKGTGKQWMRERIAEVGNTTRENE